MFQYGVPYSDPVRHSIFCSSTAFHILFQYGVPYSVRVRCSIFQTNPRVGPILLKGKQLQADTHFFHCFPTFPQPCFASESYLMPPVQRVWSVLAFSRPTWLLKGVYVHIMTSGCPGPLWQMDTHWSSQYTSLMYSHGDPLTPSKWLHVYAVFPLMESAGEEGVWQRFFLLLCVMRQLLGAWFYFQFNIKTNIFYDK